MIQQDSAFVNGCKQISYPEYGELMQLSLFLKRYLLEEQGLVV